MNLTVSLRRFSLILKYVMDQGTSDMLAESLVW